MIAFIEALTVPSGEGAGERFVLRPFQKKFIRAVYEPHGKNGRRLVRRAILSIARKNGKTALIAALALCHLVGPEAVVNGEIYSAANDREQAAIVFKFAKQMVELDPDLARHIRLVPSTKTMIGLPTGSVYRAISAEAGTKHGLNPTMVIFDELAQAKNRELYDVLDTAMGARAEPLFVTISTQSNDPEHILSKLIDDGLNSGDPRICAQVYAVPDEVDDIFDPSVWKLANPALGDFLNLEDMKAEADKAQRMPAEEPRFRNLRLNQRVSATASLLSRKEWMACAGEAAIPEGSAVYLGLDLSSTTDLTALVMVGDGDASPVQAWFWKPEELIGEHSARDFGSGHRRYEEWVAAGYMETTPGRSIDHGFVAERVAEIAGRYKVKGLAFDQWRIEDFLKQLDRIGFPAFKDGEPENGIRVVPFRQGFVSMAPAVDALERAVMERRLIHPSNPCLTWNIANAVATMDPAGNRKLDKAAARFRIDGAVALVMAIGIKERDRKEESGPSFWEVLDPASY